MYIKNILLVCQDLQKLNSEFSMITDNLGTSSFKNLSVIHVTWWEILLL